MSKGVEKYVFWGDFWFCTHSWWELTKKWLWNFLAEEAEAVFAAKLGQGRSKMRFFRVLLSFLFISGQKILKKPLRNFWCFLVLDTFHSTEIIQNCFSRGYYWFCIHSWWEQAYKITLEFFCQKGELVWATFWGQWWSKMQFFVTLHSTEIVPYGVSRCASITGENRPKK